MAGKGVIVRREMKRRRVTCEPNTEAHLRYLPENELTLAGPPARLADSATYTTAHPPHHLGSPPHRPSLSPTMFDHYSNLFTSGLLTETASSASAQAPWSSEVLGPRRGSLPMSIETMSIFSDPESSFFHPPTSSTSASTSRTVGTPNTADSSLYFTFKKRTKGAEQHLSFLSLDLAESQSVRSNSVKQKKVVSPASKATSPSRAALSTIPSNYKES